MKTEKNRLIFMLVLVGMVVLSIFFQMKHKKEFIINKKSSAEPSEKKSTDPMVEESWTSEKQIEKYANHPDDNRGLLFSESTNGKIEIKGYCKEIEKWMSEDQYEHMTNMLEQYLNKKRIFDVTLAVIHPESIVTVNDYEHILYLEINHKNDYTDQMLVKTYCDSYINDMRFAFELEYGN